MSVENSPETIELPDAKPTDRARETAVFRALAEYETRRHERRQVGTPRSPILASFMPRPALGAALATGVAVIVAVPLYQDFRERRLAPVATEMPTARSEETRPVPSVPKKAAEARPATPEPERTDAPLPPAATVPMQQAAPAAPVAVPPGRATGPAEALAPAPALDDSNRLSAEIAPPPAPVAPALLKPVDPRAGAGVGRADMPVDRNRLAVIIDQRSTLPRGAWKLGQTQQAQGPVFVPVLPEPIVVGPGAEGRDKFTAAPENPFKSVAQEPLSTFSIDVDTASYAFVRGALGRNVLPQPAAVRPEEMINYFPYDYPAPPAAKEPFATQVVVMPNPAAPGRKLLRIGIKGYELAAQERPAANLVFLIDTSGSMNSDDKLPLLIRSFGLLVETLKPTDKVSIVTYAGSAGVVLAPTAAAEKDRILAALDKLRAGGSTAGGEGIRAAYQLAQANFDPRAVNRVMLATDGDFNVGISDPNELKGFVERERGKGIFLSVLGFGRGNLNDTLMQALAQNGNGVAAYIDTLGEARKVLVQEASASLFPIAKDVKIQVEFNPAAVSDYRLIGYETRLLAREDFNNDKVDAGEVGSGASVTAIYDFVPAGGPGLVDASRYQPAKPGASGPADEYAFVKIRYKLPKSDSSDLISTPVTKASEVSDLAQAPTDARFAVAVAEFAEFLRGGRQTGTRTLDDIAALADGARGADSFGYRVEFVNLVRAAKTARGMGN